MMSGARRDLTRGPYRQLAALRNSSGLPGRRALLAVLRLCRHIGSLSGRPSRPACC